MGWRLCVAISDDATILQSEFTSLNLQDYKMRKKNTYMMLLGVQYKNDHDLFTISDVHEIALLRQ